MSWFCLFLIGCAATTVFSLDNKKSGADADKSSNSNYQRSLNNVTGAEERLANCDQFVEKMVSDGRFMTEPEWNEFLWCLTRSKTNSTTTTTPNSSTEPSTMTEIPTTPAPSTPSTTTTVSSRSKAAMNETEEGGGDQRMQGGAHR